MNKTINSIFYQQIPMDQDRERGAITVAETLIALGVGATVIAAVFAGVPALIESRNSASGLSGLAQIASSVRMTFGGRNNFNGLTTNLASDLSGFPKNFISGGSVVHPWGGAIEVTGVNHTFTVAFKNMPSNGCSTMVASTLDLADSVTVGGTTVDLTATDDGDTDDDEGAPANIGLLCEGGSKDVAWAFSS